MRVSMTSVLSLDAVRRCLHLKTAIFPDINDSVPTLDREYI